MTLRVKRGEVASVVVSGGEKKKMQEAGSGLGLSAGVGFQGFTLHHSNLYSVRVMLPHRPVKWSLDGRSVEWTYGGTQCVRIITGLVIYVYRPSSDSGLTPYTMLQYCVQIPCGPQRSHF